jgi:hypothetical protein
MSWCRIWNRWQRALEKGQRDRAEYEAACAAYDLRLQETRDQVAAAPYRLVERPDGLWRIERAECFTFALRLSPVVSWREIPDADALPTEGEALAAVQRLLSPRITKIGPDGQPLVAT